MYILFFSVYKLFLYIIQNMEWRVSINKQKHVQLLEAKIGLNKEAVNTAAAQVWDDYSDNSCQIISSSQCHFEISVHSSFLYFLLLLLLVLEQ